MLMNHASQQRYELLKNGTVVAYAAYRLDGNRIVLLHTVVPQKYLQHDYGRELAKGVLDDIMQRALKVVPECKFMAAYIESHAEYAELVASKRR